MSDWKAWLLLLILFVAASRFYDSMQNSLAESRLRTITATIQYPSENCSDEARPMSITLENIGDEMITSSSYKVSARIPGFSSETVESNAEFSTDRILEPNGPWNDCVAMPILLEHVRENPAGLEWRVEVVKVETADN